MKDDRFTMKYRVYSETHQRVIADGEGLIVMYDYKEGGKVGIPEILRDAIVSVEEEDGAYD